MGSIERAKHWVDLCSAGTGIPRDEYAFKLATLCSFGTWNIMTYAVEALLPSSVDEELEEGNV